MINESMDREIDMSDTLEARGDFDDSDSGYGDDTSMTTSIADSIYAYELENGRTYHAYNKGKYVMPNDEGEQERMDRM